MSVTMEMFLLLPPVEKAGIPPQQHLGKFFSSLCSHMGRVSCLRNSTPKAVCTRAVGFLLCTAAWNPSHSFLNHRAGLFAEQQGLKYKSGQVLNRLMVVKFVMLSDIRRLV